MFAEFDEISFYKQNKLEPGSSYYTTM